MKLSILVPLFNETKIIELSLTQLRNSLVKFHEVVPSCEVEVILSDAGSHDGTLEKAEKLAQAFHWTLVSRQFARPSVGKTVAAALGEANGDTAVILPCDIWISSRALQRLSEVLSSGEIEAGAFYKSYSSPSTLLSFYGFLQNKIRLSLFRHSVWTNGIFFRLSCLKRIDFPVVGFLEDVILSDWLRKKKFAVITDPLQVSARGYLEQGILKRILMNGFIMSLYRMGYWSPTTLKKLYKIVR